MSFYFLYVYFAQREDKPDWAASAGCLQTLRHTDSDWENSAIGPGPTMLSLSDVVLLGHLKPIGSSRGAAAGVQFPGEKDRKNCPQKGRKTARKTPQFFPTIFLD